MNWGMLMLMIVAFILIDLYIFQFVKTAVNGSADTTRKLIYFFYTFILLVGYATGLAFIFSDYHFWNPMVRKIAMGIMFATFASRMIVLPFLIIDDSIRLFKWLPHLFDGKKGAPTDTPGISRSEFLSKSALLVGGTMFMSFIWGVVKTGTSYKIRRVKVPLKNTPLGLKGLKIVQVSDMHLGSFASTNPIQRAVKIINELNADLIFFTGDLVNDIADEAVPFISILSQLKAKYGVYSTLGNHDYGDYVPWKDEVQKNANIQKVKDIHGQNGWKMLNNSNETLSIGGASLAIIGVENWGHSNYFPKYGDLDLACKGCEDADVKLLLSHDPSHWNYIVKDSKHPIDITFSGHTHGFQFGIEIPALKIKWSPVQYAYKQWAGLYKSNDKHLYVNRGLGFLGYPGRVGIPPEITLMELA